MTHFRDTVIVIVVLRGTYLHPEALILIIA